MDQNAHMCAVAVDVGALSCGSGSACCSTISFYFAAISSGFRWRNLLKRRRLHFICCACVCVCVYILHISTALYRFEAVLKMVQLSTLDKSSRRVSLVCCRRRAVELSASEWDVQRNRHVMHMLKCGMCFQCNDSPQ